MKVAITGASGLIGTAVSQRLRALDIEVYHVTRNPKTKKERSWDPIQGVLDRDVLDGMDAVIHLAGESLYGLRWSKTKKKNIIESRVKSTRLLVNRFQTMRQPPKVFISASAIGYYGDTGHHWVTEESPPGNTFLAGVCEQWEWEARKAEAQGIRVVSLRTGLVLAPDGGVLKQIATPFMLGLGGSYGDGDQGMSWISLRDTVSVIVKLLLDDTASGAFNVVAPNAVTNDTFMTTLGHELRRPTLLRLPRTAIRVGLGEMSDLLLVSSWVKPQRLKNIDFVFHDPYLDQTLKRLVGSRRNEVE